jgi:four helix bundle protein
VGSFRELDVWKISKNLAVKIYQLTSVDCFSKDYGLKDQIRRASVSIASNIAEGDESGYNNQSIRYFHIAKGSSAEVQTQSVIAYEIGYLEKHDYEKIVEQCKMISAKLEKLIQYRRKHLK